MPGYQGAGCESGCEHAVCEEYGCDWMHEHLACAHPAGEGSVGGNVATEASVAEAPASIEVSASIEE